MELPEASHLEKRPIASSSPPFHTTHSERHACYSFDFPWKAWGLQERDSEDSQSQRRFVGCLEQRKQSLDRTPFP